MPYCASITTPPLGQMTTSPPPLPTLSPAVSPALPVVVFVVVLVALISVALGVYTLAQYAYATAVYDEEGKGFELTVFSSRPCGELENPRSSLRPEQRAVSPDVADFRSASSLRSSVNHVVRPSCLYTHSNTSSACVAPAAAPSPARVRQYRISVEPQLEAIEEREEDATNTRPSFRYDPNAFVGRNRPPPLLRPIVFRNDVFPVRQLTAIVEQDEDELDITDAA
ncbi:hypothetical protein EXIGLDRAFT_770606 [Exidia glandulosa HHB12029]|uniref:Transmembrane protein n=1 Tax=Exidia glandulosa HHB12029 TaxID=1314781 RepID=A0A165GK36_EXIGL|nr:hypothetical protein EXIGLDRAFT_770606 [Exidia glandulosa HHB12029]